MKKFIILITVGLLGSLSGQTTWDTGTINFDYGNPFPSESVAYSGSFLSNDIPGQGAGGFTLHTGDTHILSLVAYDIHVTATDTLADIFTIIIQDTVEIQAGTHLVGLGTNSNKVFLWMRDVDPALVAVLLDTSFTLDSLSVLDPYLSVFGQIEISTLSETSITGSFSGTMANTSLEFLVVNGGAFSLTNTLPQLTFNQGSLAVMAGPELTEIEGELNPFQNTQGVGGIESSQGDTVTTTIFAYTSNDTGDGFSIYGVAFKARAENYPSSGEQLVYNIGTTSDDFPVALPFYLANSSLEQLTQLLTVDSLSQIEGFDNIFLPAGTGIANLGYNSDQEAWVAIPDILMANAGGSTLVFMEEWSLRKSSPTGIASASFQQPVQKSLVGPVFPNPFNSTTIIPFQLTEFRSLDLIIYNMRGQQVAILPMGTYGAGLHEYHLNLGALDLSGGLYYFKVRSANLSLGSGSFLYLK